MNADDKSKVGELNDTLYSRTRYTDPTDKRSPVQEVEVPEVKENWQGTTLDELLSHEQQAPEIKPFMKKFFVFALLFFIATIIVAGFVFLGGANFISSKNVDIEVVGPTIVSAGELLDLSVTIKNDNNSDLETANFSVQYPAGSRDPQDSTKTLTYTKKDLGEVGAGDEAVENVRLVLIGSTGEVKELKFSVEYKVRGSNATFYKDKIYEVTIGDSPLSLNVDTPSSVTSGETFTTLLSISHNSTEILRNVMLKAEYPYGYTVTDASPQAVSDNNVWALGDLSPGSSKKIQIRGRLVGEDEDERTMRFYAGVADNGGSNPDFKTIILSTLKTIAIDKPSLELVASFNGENAETYIAPAGKGVSTSVRFKNNMPEKILNPRLEARLSGNALNRSSVFPLNSGVYDQGRNRINWTIINSQGLAELSPGESGMVFFSFASVPETALTSAGRDIELELILSGVPAGENRTLSVSESRTVRVASQVTFVSKALHSQSQFTPNTGPIPPKVGQETTYTVVWTLGNTQNDLSDAKVTAKLGSNVKWLGANSTDPENISYDEAKNTATWEMGTLNSGTGFSLPAREVTFRVGLTPTNLQAGTAPVLVNSIVFSGFDAAQNKAVSVTSSALTTKVSSDPAFIQGDDIVVK